MTKGKPTVASVRKNIQRAQRSLEMLQRRDAKIWRDKEGLIVGMKIPRRLKTAEKHLDNALKSLTKKRR